MRFQTATFSPPKQKESDIQKAVMEHLSAAGWVVIRINGGSFKDKSGNYIRNYIVQGLKDRSGNHASAGFPDVLALKGRHFLLLECKTEKGEASPAQMKFGKFAHQRDVAIYVVRSVKDVDPILKELKEELENGNNNGL